MHRGCLPPRACKSQNPHPHPPPCERGALSGPKHLPYPALAVCVGRGPPPCGDSSRLVLVAHPICTHGFISLSWDSSAVRSPILSGHMNQPEPCRLNSQQALLLQRWYFLSNASSMHRSHSQSTQRCNAVLPDAVRRTSVGCQA